MPRHTGTRVSAAASRVARTRRFPVVAEDHGYESPCWIWHGAVSTAGYGTRGKPDAIPVKLVQVHKQMFELAFGSLEDGQILHHLCEQKRCCNPNHLAVTTRAEHNLIHGGQFDRQVARDLYEVEGLTLQQIGDRLGVSYSAIQKQLGGRKTRGIRSGRFLDMSA